jgi:hypothetical protein
MSKFKIIEVPSDSFQEQETMGTKPKFWFLHSEFGYCLFKQTRQHTGEDWSEKVAEELCKLLEIPHARYELAVWREFKGVVSHNFVSESENLIAGNEILQKLDPEYPKENRFHVAKHTINAVFNSLENLQVKMPKYSLLNGIETASEVFLGYLMLDAWIGNTDRHHENWALIQNKTDYFLAPSHDHAASLGCILLDTERHERIITKDKQRNVEFFAKRGTSALYENDEAIKPVSMLGAFCLASLSYTNASKVWLNRLNDVSISEIETIFENIPENRISDTAKHFALEILIINQKRLIELL